MDLLLDVVKASSVRNVVHRDTSMRVAVVSLRDGAEPFLTSSIPNLHFKDAVVNLERLDFEINTDGAKVVLVEDRI